MIKPARVWARSISWGGDGRTTALTFWITTGHIISVANLQCADEQNAR